MTIMLTVTLDKPVYTAQVLEAHAAGESAESSTVAAELQRVLEGQLAQVEAQQNQLGATLQLLDDMIAKCNQFYEQVLTTHRKEIARLSLEIARKVLSQQIKDGDYHIEAIIQEALQNAPVQQGITVHLSPEDLTHCQEIQAEQPDGPLSKLTLVSDVAVGRAECWLETPKGVIQSFINEHINKIAEALEKAS